MQNEQQMTLKDWIITIILLFLPLVGFIMLIIWAVDKNDPRNTFSKAYLIVSIGFFVVMFLFYFIFFIFMMFLGLSMQ